MPSFQPSESTDSSKFKLNIGKLDDGPVKITKIPVKAQNSPRNKNIINYESSSPGSKNQINNDHSTCQVINF